MYKKRPLKYSCGFLRYFSKPEIYPEALFAYFHRLPRNIQVSWFRDDGMIVGNVEAGEKQFVTQGENPRDFIEMVNEAVLLAFNTPDDYLETIKKIKRYSPPVTELELLNDQSIAGRTFGLNQEELGFRVA